MSSAKTSPSRRHRRRLGLLGGLAAAGCLLLGALGAAPALATNFGVTIDGVVVDQNGEAATQAGSHPFAASTDIAFTTDPETGFPTEAVKDLVVDLPPGFVGNPQAVPKCTSAELTGSGCPDASQVGETLLDTPLGPLGPFDVFNMTPGPNEPARFGFVALLVPVSIHTRIRTESDYGLTTVIPNLSNAVPTSATSLTFFGVVNGQPFLTNPTACRGPLVTTLYADSWQEPAAFNPDGTPDLSDPNWETDSFLSHDPNNPELTGGPTGCDALEFDPTLDVQGVSSAADSPTGLEVDLGIPQAPEDPNGLVTAHLEKTVVHLPEGLTLNPAAADGLGSCSPAQIGLGSAEEPSCPDASKIGTIEIHSPLLTDPMQGSIYLAEQNNNPFGSLLAIYLVAEEQGVLVKLPGKIEADPQTGRLDATFDDTPQLPLSDFKLNFFGGSRAALATPPACGTYEMTSEISPWSGPPSLPNTGPPDTPSASFEITTGPGGGPCSTPFAPSFHAGTQNPVAGAASPFIVRLSRADGTEQLSSLDVDLPPGMLAKLAGVPHCSDAEAQLAALGAGGCPAGSRVGGVKIGAGAGPNPFYLPGDVYLTGGYKGAPFGLAIVVHALAGPFDLGTIVVRAALFIDSDDAQIHVVTDQIPHILKGIPLRVRDIQVLLDRPDFTVNPSTCAPMSVGGTAHGLNGGLANFAEHFQLTGCGSLGFAPQLRGAIVGGAKQTKRSAHPDLQFDLTTRPGDANLSSVALLLPSSLQIDAFNLGNLCTETELAQAQCAGHSPIGSAAAETPLLGGGLSGPVFAVSGSGLLPRLAVILHGSASEPLTLVIRGNVDTPGGRIQNTFVGIPDAPLSHFRLSLSGGPQGLLVNNRNLCGAKKKGKKGKKGKPGLTANASFLGHNGDTRSQKVSIAAKCKKGKKKKKK